MKSLFGIISLFCFLKASEAAFCEIVPPLDGDIDGSEYGFIFVPGAQIKGEFYGPLSLAIQAMFPGKMWIGLTEGWFGNFPNPLEINGAISDCFTRAKYSLLKNNYKIFLFKEIIISDLGLSTEKVFQAGHSLGGIMLESWARDHPEMSAGILLFGSYLPNGFFGNGETNVFPVPVLTAVGSLDGGSLSYITREWIESNDPQLEGKYPVLIIDRVNHAQVASGEIPDIVIQQDVDAEIDGEEAYKRYAEASVAFMVTSRFEEFNPETVAEQLNIMEGLQRFTNDFLAPFQEMRLLEHNDERTISPWIIEAQKIISGAAKESISKMIVTNELVDFSDIGGVKPQIGGSDCEASIQTFGHNSYPLDPLDFGGLISASVIKAKFKLEDVVLETLCENEKPRNQCRDVNLKAFETALAATDKVTLKRFLDKGRHLVFGDDYVSPWGPGWEFSTGLTYNNLDESTVEIVSTSLISEPDFIISSAAGMHYCDLLSPYRALEWIYITGVQHG